MATAPQGTDAKSLGGGRTAVTVCVIVAMILVILFLTCRFKKGPGDARDIRSLYYTRSPRKPPRKGISKEAIEAIPLARYSIVVSTPKRNPAEHSEARGSTWSREGIIGKTALIRDIQPIFHTKSQVIDCFLESFSDRISDVCVICEEVFLGSDEVRVLPCDHIYHRHCIDPWLLGVSGTCPEWFVSSNSTSIWFLARF